MISILHPSRGRPEKSWETITKWVGNWSGDRIELEIIVSLDPDDNCRTEYFERYSELRLVRVICMESTCAVHAINNAARMSTGNVLFVVSDDTDCFPQWDVALYSEVNNKKDWILKTQDGIQNWIITNPIMDRTYYNRTQRIYSHKYKHQFCDTHLTVEADISGRKLTSNLMFRHLNDTIKDDVRKRSDATWDEGQRTFIYDLKQWPIEDLRKITDQSMKNWIRNYAGIRL